MDLELVTEIDDENPIIGDLRLVNGQLSWVGADPTDEEDQRRMVTQRCRCRLLFFQGEWYQDQLQGTPWRQHLLGKGVTRSRASQIFRKVIEGTPGVAEVVKLEVELDGTQRIGSLAFEVRTEAGQLVTVEDLNLPFILSEEVTRG